MRDLVFLMAITIALIFYKKLEYALALLVLYILYTRIQKEGFGMSEYDFEYSNFHNYLHNERLLNDILVDEEHMDTLKIRLHKNENDYKENTRHFNHTLKGIAKMDNTPEAEVEYKDLENTSKHLEEKAEEIVKFYQDIYKHDKIRREKLLDSLKKAFNDEK